MAQLEGYYFSAALSCTFLVSCLLFSAFSRALREPYMDEIFHLPQAQRYCEGRFSLSQTNIVWAAFCAGHIIAQKFSEAWKTELQKKKEERLPPVKGQFSELRRVLHFLLVYSMSFKNLSMLFLLTWPYILLLAAFLVFVVNMHLTPHAHTNAKVYLQTDSVAMLEALLRKEEIKYENYGQPKTAKEQPGTATLFAYSGDSENAPLHEGIS
ncbi:Dol-P-Glc:Glc(2)Man(9)GlcNAc(2)-PP-Dol alpha-1,2-glucosyltransferase [Microtus ochrogaster]|uniref:Dol-P-Glc:Glc(2)Man(9)GlcNAc(2)-PP-Dol alpha-1,2-glucosyltransferase n=1 Tax=Microtus ochrogaster TaxID=79684 RepID=A0A8J6LA91_MICOH|nr:Dol-P-Glc:Glc(2)Man(9)GlcNAc(2)-PP-Dol alpha-1,2-glucosyltransferase [Microtus ochrogaster]